MIAVFLGWLILSEEITPFVVAGTAVIVASVAFVVLSPAEDRRASVPPLIRYIRRTRERRWS